jgi:hypothetical protein
VATAAMEASIVTIIPLSNTRYIISLKLTNTNYLYWWMQMKLYFLKQGVFQFVDGALRCPPPHIATTNGSSLQVNPYFFRWKQQDQLILSAPISSLSIHVLHLVADC